MTRGIIISYDPHEGEGYISPDEDHERIPFDRKSLVGFAVDEHPRAGDRVSFQVEGGLAGTWATNVSRIEKGSST